MPLKVYDETTRVLKTALGRAKLGEGERLAAIRRLDERARVVEAAAVTEGEFAAESNGSGARRGTLADAWSPTLRGLGNSGCRFKL